MIQTVISPNDNSEDVAIEAQQLTSEKGKIKDWKFNNAFRLDKKRESSGLD